MPVLKNTRYELFAQEVAKGVHITDAHENAGYKRNDGNASTLAARPEISDRIKELKDLGAEKAAITIGRVLAELGKLGFSNMDDYVTVGTDGLPFVDFSRLNRDQKAAIQEVHVETTMSSEINEAGEREAVPVRKVRFKLADKRMALVDIGKHLGMFKEQIEHTIIEDDTRSSTEILEEIRAMVADLGIAMPAGVVLADPAENGVANRPRKGNGSGNGTAH